MKYDILVRTLVNEQPEHVFVQHHGIREGKVADLFRETVQEQYDRLERGKPLYRADSEAEGFAGMTREFADGAVTTVVVHVVHTAEAYKYWEAQERVRKGESQA